MALELHEQFHNLLKERKHVLITTSFNPTDDAIVSAAALALFLDANDVRSDIVIHDFEKHSELNFISKVKDILPKFEYLRKFILNVNIKKTGLRELSYDTSKEELRIFITPKSGVLDKTNITTSTSTFRYDAIVVLGAEDLESIGPLYEKHPDLFFETPLIQIGRSVSSESFGHMNILDVTASSIAEMLFGIFTSLGKEYITEQVAEALLTGMISETHSFKQKNVTPKALNIASKLIQYGADRDNIISELYRTRTINSLKLWGEALSHIQSDASKKFVWTSITREAFTRSGASEADLKDLVRELISSSPEAETILILHEHSNDQHTIHGILYSSKHDAKELLKKFNPTGTNQEAQVRFNNKSLKEIETLLLQEIKQQI